MRIAVGLRHSFCVRNIRCGCRAAAVIAAFKKLRRVPSIRCGSCQWRDYYTPRENIVAAFAEEAP